VKLPDTLSFRAGSLLQKKQRTAEHPAFLLISLPAPIAVLRRCHLRIDNLFCFFQRITQATEIPRRIFDLKLAAAKSNAPVKTLNTPPEISRAIETTPHLPHLTPIPNCAGAP
jgi:hypothetical protein